MRFGMSFGFRAGPFYVGTGNLLSSGRRGRRSGGAQRISKAEQAATDAFWAEHPILLRVVAAPFVAAAGAILYVALFGGPPSVSEEIRQAEAAHEQQAVQNLSKRHNAGAAEMSSEPYMRCASRNDEMLRAGGSNFDECRKQFAPSVDPPGTSDYLPMAQRSTPQFWQCVERNDAIARTGSALSPTRCADETGTPISTVPACQPDQPPDRNGCEMPEGMISAPPTTATPTPSEVPAAARPAIVCRAGRSGGEVTFASFENAWAKKGGVYSCEARIPLSYRLSRLEKAAVAIDQRSGIADGDVDSLEAVIASCATTVDYDTVLEATRQLNVGDFIDVDPDRLRAVYKLCPKAPTAHLVRDVIDNQ